jgi:hypothetical protein
MARALRRKCAYEWSNLYRAEPVLHQERALWPRLPWPSLPAGLRVGLACLGLVLWLTAVVFGAAAAAQPSAAGWLQLERDQRTYRERAGPLDLREARELSTVERRQRNDLRAVEQRLERRAPRQPAPRATAPLAEPGTVTAPPEVPRPGSDMHQGRALERERLQLRMRQYRQPFGRQRPP